MGRRVTMKDVALKAKVSASTVCRALSNSPQIPPATRERIRKVAMELGYRPDPLLSAFASRRRGKIAGSEITTVAYITNFPRKLEWKEIPFYWKTYCGAKKRLEELGYNLEHFWLKEEGMTASRLSRILTNRGISAICVAPTHQVRGHLSLDWERFSCVTVGYSVLRPNMHRSTPHHFHGMMEAARQLFRRGYQRIGLCLFTGTSKRVDELWLAAALLVKKRNPKRRMSVFLFNDATLHKAAEWAEKEKLQVVVSDNQVAIDVMRQQGIRVPGDLDFATLNWVETEPEVAGIDQLPDMVGAAAMDLVLSKVRLGERGIPDMPTTTMVEGHWVDGASITRT